jgi:hypothetical protein
MLDVCVYVRGCAGLAFSSFFRFLAYAAPNLNAAQSFSGPIVAQLVLFAGFLVTRSRIQDWLRVFYWVLNLLLRAVYLMLCV